MTTHLSKDRNMLNAYSNGKDLYAIIAQSAFNNDYYDNLEFYREFTEVDLSGQKVIAGSGKEYHKVFEANSLTLPSCYLIQANGQEKDIASLEVGDSIISDQGNSYQLTSVNHLGKQPLDERLINMTRLEVMPSTNISSDTIKVSSPAKILNTAGKERRSVGKVLNLSATYGMSSATAGAKLGKSKEEGETLLNNFFKDFIGVKTAIDSSKKFLKENGYVEDFLGRRRRLSDINLRPYKAVVKNKIETDIDFNPFFECQDRKNLNNPEFIWNQIIDQYILISNAFYACKVLKEVADTKEASMSPEYEFQAELPKTVFEKLTKLAMNPSYVSKQPWSTSGRKTYEQKIAEDANIVKNLITTGEYFFYDFTTKQQYVFNLKDSFKNFNLAIKNYITQYGQTVQATIPAEQTILTAWTGKIAQAARQCFNARIQGSAASLTKLAMVDIYNDKLMKKYQAKLIIPVHDELLVECPEFYAEEVEKRLPEIMIAAAKRGGDEVPQSCDPYSVSRWASDVCAAFMQKEFSKLKQKGYTQEDALEEMKKRHSEIPEDSLVKVLVDATDEVIF